MYNSTTVCLFLVISKSKAMVTAAAKKNPATKLINKMLKGII